MENLYILLPELIMFVSICSLLMLGVFLKNSYSLISNLSLLVLILIGVIIFDNGLDRSNIFLGSFIQDPLSNFSKILILISSFFVFISSQQFIRDKKLIKFEYPIIILISLLGMFFMVSAGDLILFYLGIELQSLSLYILASIDRDNLKSTESGIKYFVLSALSSGLLLYGCSLLYGFTGSTNFETISQTLDYGNTGAVFAMVFILVGLAFKVSAVPFHMWTPDVYEGAPTSITCFFAVVPKITGLVVVLRFMDMPFKNIINDWQLILIFMSIASMILGAVAAIGQNNIKRLMAYSSIGHIGYMLAGVATGTPSGYSSSLLYMSIYVVMNIGAFSCIYLMKRKGNYTEEIKDLAGISKKNPLIAIAFLVVFFSLAGIPPLGGFFAKFYVFMAVIENEMFILATIGLLTTVISAFYYLRIIKIIYFDESKFDLEETKSLGVNSSLTLCCLVLLTFFLYPSILNNLIYSLFS